MKTGALISAALILSGCAAQKVAQDYQRDSVRIETVERIIYKDSLIFVPVPSGESSAVLPDSDTSRLETSLAESEAFVKDGELHHTLRNKEAAILPVEIKLPQIIRQEHTNLIRDRKIIETVTVEKELSKWQRFIMSLGYGLLAAALIWLARKASKYIL